MADVAKRWFGNWLGQVIVIALINLIVQATATAIFVRFMNDPTRRDFFIGITWILLLVGTFTFVIVQAARRGAAPTQATSEPDNGSEVTRLREQLKVEQVERSNLQRRVIDEAEISIGVRAILSQQRENWQTFLSLELQDVDCSHINDAACPVTFKLLMRNYTLETVELTKVMNTAASFDVHILPQLPQIIGFSLGPCQEGIVSIRVDMTGDLPKHLRTEAALENPRYLGWKLEGDWYVKVGGEERLVWGRSKTLSKMVQVRRA